MEEVVAVVCGIVYLQKVEQDDRIVPIGFVDLMFENELGRLCRRLLPLFSRLVFDHLGERPHRLYSGEKRPVLA